MMNKDFHLHPGDITQCTSYLTHIMQLNKKLLLPSELTSHIASMYRCLEGIGALDENTKVPLYLESIDKDRNIVINRFKIFIHDPWLSKLILISSLNHCNSSLLCLKHYYSFAMSQGMALFRPERKESIHLLKLVIILIKFLDFDSEKKFVVTLFRFSQLVASSPLKGFKEYAEKIAKKSLSIPGIEKVSFLCYLPVRAINSHSNLKFKTLDSKVLVEKIVEMFCNNVENREGGLLYKDMLKQSDFDHWASKIWPHFQVSFCNIDIHGEFLQSLLKYWIPHTVQAYQAKAYTFLSAENVLDILKGYILFETRKKFFITKYNSQDWHLIKRLSNSKANCGLALEIIGSSFKSSMTISENELGLVRKYLEEREHVLYAKEAKALQRFLSHVVTVQSDGCIKFVQELFLFSISLLKSRRRNLGAQILSDLWLANKEMFSNQLKSNHLHSLIEQTLVERNGSDSALSKLAVLVIDTPITLTNTFLLTFIEESCTALSIQASDSVRNMVFCIASINAKQSQELNAALLIMLHKQLQFQFETELTIRDIFKSALILIALTQVSKVVKDDDINKDNAKWICSVCFPIVADLLVEKFENKNSNMLKARSDKIFEALYNNLCQFLIENKSAWSMENYFYVMDSVVKVIECSSMKRPTMISSELLKHFAVMIGEDANSLSVQMINFKTTLLFSTLSKLNQTTPLQSLTIRRNPETRLVIHALCSSDASPEKTILTTTLKHLFGILSDKSKSNATTAATLYCLELLMSDNSLYEWTLQYAFDAILMCVKHFENRNWSVRNACIQLEKALIDRFLGVHTSASNRSKSVQDLFLLFPHLARMFYEVLIQVPLKDSSLVVMQFFIESQIRPLPFPSEIIVVTREAFLSVFTTIILDNPDVYGIFAARAYVSLCLQRELSQVISHVVDFVIRNFGLIRNKGTLRNFMILLKELSRNCKYDFESLSEFLSACSNPEQFDLMLLKLLSRKNSLIVLQGLQSHLTSNYRHRLWLNNYIPILMQDHLPSVVKLLGNYVIPECLQVKVLCMLLDKLDVEQGDEVLFSLLKNLPHSEPKSNYLWMCYFQIYLLIFERLKTVSELKLLMPKIEHKNIHETCLYHLILSTNPVDPAKNKNLAKSTLRQFQSHLNDEISEDISRTLQYVYSNCLQCHCINRQILTLSFRLLINHGHWHFIEFITRSSIPNPVRALKDVLKYRFLSSFLGDDWAAFQFVSDVNKMNNTKRKLEVSNMGTFYEAEEEVHVDLDLVVRAVTEFLREFCERRKLNYYELKKENICLLK
ncbi:uncharacterized protein [Euwallacea fornicatus]|uniref:uncharacterized protein isoform X2 n=1 Tax=Euwallacea fornicatus TaxID=995702 RepID=UPI00338F29E1